MISVKLRISQKPKIAHFFLPPIKGLTSPSFIILEPMIYAPAEPKTRERRAPILMIALWTRAVSYFPSSYELLAADSGFLAISITWCIIFSEGLTINLLMSSVKKCSMPINVIHTNKVLAIEKTTSKNNYMRHYEHYPDNKTLIWWHSCRFIYLSVWESIISWGSINSSFQLLRWILLFTGDGLSIYHQIVSNGWVS